MCRSRHLLLPALLSAGLSAGLASGAAEAAPRLQTLLFKSQPGAAVTLNPQPLPPKSLGKGAPGGGTMLNPQPLPPKWRRPQVEQAF